MKALLISFVAACLWGEQAGGWLLTKKIQAINVASSNIAGEREDQQQRPNVQSAISAVHRRNRQ